MVSSSLCKQTAIAGTPAAYEQGMTYRSGGGLLRARHETKTEFFDELQVKLIIFHTTR